MRTKLVGEGVILEGDEIVFGTELHKDVKGDVGHSILNT